MKPPAIHVCFASGQNLPNLIPAIQSGSTEVWILQTAEMRSGARFLADALRRRGITRIEFIDFADADVATLHQEAAAVAEKLDGRAVTVNLTGGTKLMTLALVDTLVAHLATGTPDSAPHLVYTDTRNQRLDWLKPVPCSEPLGDVLRMDDVLFVQGYRRDSGSGGPETAHWQIEAQRRSSLTRMMGDKAAELAAAFGLLNKLADDALTKDQDQFVALQHLRYRAKPEMRRILELAMGLQLVTWDGGLEVTFTNEDTARYFRGLWVEEYVGLKITGLPRKDWAPNLRVRHVGSDVVNEIDAMVVHRNRVLIVECKSRSSSKVDVSDWIYKLSQLATQVGGSMATPLLVSARGLTEPQMQRARQYRIDVLAAADVGRLGTYLRSWYQS